MQVQGQHWRMGTAGVGGLSIQGEGSKVRFVNTKAHSLTHAPSPSELQAGTSQGPALPPRRVPPSLCFDNSLDDHLTTLPAPAQCPQPSLRPRPSP